MVIGLWTLITIAFCVAIIVAGLVAGRMTINHTVIVNADIRDLTISVEAGINKHDQTD